MAVAVSPPPAPVDEAPPVVQPPPGNPRFPLLDAVRAIAALGVLFAHVGGLTGTVDKPIYGPVVANFDEGVTMFFVLSGFLLYRPFVAARARGRSAPALRDYARRRGLRILPAYWLAVTLAAIYPGLPDVFGPHWWRFYSLTQVYWHGSVAGGLPATWSLSVELSFYVLLPLLAWALLRLRTARQQIAALVLLGVASAGFRAIDLFYQQRHDNSGGWTTRTTLLELFLWFAAGMVLATVSVAREKGHTPRSVAWIADHGGACWLLGIAGYLGMCSLLVKPKNQFTYGGGQWMLQHVGSLAVALALIAPAVFVGRRQWPHRLLAWRPLAWLGLISYGIFLWHGAVLPVLQRHGIMGYTYLGAAGVTLAITVILAAASYYIVERPLLRLKYRRPLRTASR